MYHIICMRVSLRRFKFIHKQGGLVIMKNKLEAIQKEFSERLSTAVSPDKLEELKVAYLGKKGELTSILKGIFLVLALYLAFLHI